MGNRESRRRDRSAASVPHNATIQSQQQQQQQRAQPQQQPLQLRPRRILNSVIQTYENGRYEGQFQRGLKHGYGEYRWSTGHRYVGEWKRDMMDGFGCYTWPDGRSYEGEFKEDRFHGKGTYEFGDGSKYVGEFMDDLCDGRGTYYADTGQTFVHNWVCVHPTELLWNLPGGVLPTPQYEQQQQQQGAVSPPALSVQPQGQGQAAASSSSGGEQTTNSRHVASTTSATSGQGAAASSQRGGDSRSRHRDVVPPGRVDQAHEQQILFTDEPSGNWTVVSIPHEEREGEERVMTSGHPNAASSPSHLPPATTTTTTSTNTSAVAASTAKKENEVVVLPREDSSQFQEGSGKCCVVCLDAPRSYVVVPCGHMCLCKDCAEEVKTKMKLCPLCRTSVNAIIRVYQ